MDKPYTKAELEEIVMGAFYRLFPSANPGYGCALAAHESGWEPRARSLPGATDDRLGGAWGLLQMTLNTAQGLGFTGAPDALLDPHICAHYAAKLCMLNSRQVGGAPYAWIAAYNCGAHAVQTMKIPKSTKDEYVPAVLALYQERYEQMGLDYIARKQAAATPVNSTSSESDAPKALA